MQIVNEFMEAVDGFELDTEKVGLRSLSVSEVKLPYTGALPEALAGAKDVCLYFNVQLIRGVRVILMAEDLEGQPILWPVRMTSTEIMAVLDRFFGNANFPNLGLGKYWAGWYQAHYMEWRALAKAPLDILPVLFNLSEQDRRYIQKHILDGPESM